MINEIQCKTALNHLKRKIPYEWDLNIYRGCNHGCKYCYALYSHEYLGDNNYFENIYVKKNVVEVLEKELKSKKWNRGVVNIGGVTDSYQSCEKKYELMPEVLKLLIKYKTPAIISTKSDLILRDYDLIDQLSRITCINIACTITTMDEKIRKKIEPNSVSSKKRFEVLKTFRKTNASVGVHVMPIIPFLTDGEKNLEEIFSISSDIKAHYLLPGTLYLRGKTREYFFDFVKNEFPNIYPKLKKLYIYGGANKIYKDALYARVNKLREKYGVSSSYTKAMREKMGQSI
jgi:DNA repair photolyase